MVFLAVFIYIVALAECEKIRYNNTRSNAMVHWFAKHENEALEQCF